jgi:hypothetical protein
VAPSEITCERAAAFDRAASRMNVEGASCAAPALRTASTTRWNSLRRKRTRMTTEGSTWGSAGYFCRVMLCF